MSRLILNTFDQVVSWYNRTNPIVSNLHTREDDIRPIWKRNRKHERIKKIDDNAYALLDGNYGGYTNEYDNSMAPITWMRREDGDYIRIRNHRVGQSAPSRYSFLHTYLPERMGFRIENGKHFIRAKVNRWTDGCCVRQFENFPLPKCITNSKEYTYGVRDDINLLVFKVVGDGDNRTYELANERPPTYRKVIDKTLKAEFKPYIDNFYEQLNALGGMFETNYPSILAYQNQMREYAKASTPRYKSPVIYAVAGNFLIDPTLFREIVKDTEHPLRVAALAMMAYGMDWRHTVSHRAASDIRADYNRRMNKALDLYTNVEN